MSKRVTVVVPVYNEEGNIEALYRKVDEVFASLSTAYDWQLLFVDDGSSDASVATINGLCAADARVKLIELSRNFGKEAALSAGMSYAEGDAVVLMDADLQHPPQVIADLLSRWEEGAEVVVGVRTANPDEGLLRKTGSRIFTSFMGLSEEMTTVVGATDFRLLDRIVVDEFNRFTEHGRIARGLIDWLGFKREYVPFAADKRHTGVAQYSGQKLVELAVMAFTSHSMLPLRLAGYLGVFITFLAGSLGLFILVEQLILGDPLMLQIPATAMLAVMIMFLNGTLLISIGLVSLYIAKIHTEAVNRPLFVVRRSKEN